ncbi:perlucin-like protein isoform X2 [Macrobrachium rosenbergii]|uniref:perlucin-like protein isoform X2 n=1 Tax=Macrobrachium rosenbergii TaxID=79674 RepID=UPI0034D5AB15
MERLRMAVANGFRLLATILLLATAGRCYRVQMEQSQIGRIADSIDNLTHVVQAQAVASEKFSSGIMNMFNLLAADRLVCEEGWSKLRSSCYFFSNNTRTWQQGRQECKNMNSDLVKITDDEEYNFLRNLVKGHHTFVGLSDQQEEGTFRWVAVGTIPSVVKPGWWREGEPNNCESCVSDIAGEDCVHYGADDDGFNDVSCTWKIRYICEKPAHLSWGFASVLGEETPSDK